jgi:hypothetical protein
VGRYYFGGRPDIQLNLLPDGTANWWQDHSRTYTVNGIQITIDTPDCLAPGVYDWKLDGTILTLTPIKETCAARHILNASLLHTSLVKQPAEPMAPAGDVSALAGRYLVGGAPTNAVDLFPDGTAYWFDNYGRYTVSGDQVTFVDVWDCSLPGVYQWKLDGTALHLTVINDACGSSLSRQDLLDGKTLIRQPEQPFAQIDWMRIDDEGSGLAVDAQGNSYLVSSDRFRVTKFSPDGLPLMAFGGSGTGDGQFQGMGGAFVDGQGNIYVVDSGGVRVEKFDASGKYLTSFKLQGVTNPRGVAVDGQGNVYVSLHGHQADHYVEKWSSDGKLLLTFGSNGTGDGQFSAVGPDGGPLGMNVDPQGNVYVTDPDNNRVQKFDTNSKYLLSLTGSADHKFVTPFGVAIDGAGNVYVTDETKTLYEFDPAGKLLGTWVMPFPDAVRIDPAGNVHLLIAGELAKVSLPRP